MSKRQHRPDKQRANRFSRAIVPGAFAALLTTVFAVSACGSREPEAVSNARVSDQSDSTVYKFGAASRDGIGKFYMGREISHVMGHLGAGWLERPARQQEERTGEHELPGPMPSG